MNLQAFAIVALLYQTLPPDDLQDFLSELDRDAFAVALETYAADMEDDELVDLVTASAREHLAEFLLPKVTH